MRRMFSKKQIERMVAENPAAVVEALKNQDVSINGLTSKGIANTGGFGNIGDVAISGDLSVSGDISGKMFQSGDLELSEITGITFSYGKWAISGNHLMIVLAGVLESGNTIADNTILANVPVPQWILDKIYPVFGKIVEQNPTLFYSSEYTTTSKNIGLRKPTDTSLQIVASSGAISFTENRAFRVEIDLTII